MLYLLFILLLLGRFCEGFRREYCFYGKVDLVLFIKIELGFRIIICVGLVGRISFRSVFLVNKVVFNDFKKLSFCFCLYYVRGCWGVG